MSVTTSSMQVLVVPEESESHVRRFLLWSLAKLFFFKTPKAQLAALDDNNASPHIQSKTKRRKQTTS